VEERKFNTGYIPSPPDERDYPIARILKTEKPTLKKVQLPKSPIHIDQGNIPKCVGSSFVGIYNAYYSAIGELPHGGFSDDYLYQRCKQLDGIPNVDGTYPRIAMMVALHEGICTKKVWDENGKTLNQATIADAKKYKIKAYARLYTLDEMKLALADGKYLMFANQVTSDWMKSPCKDNGYIPCPPVGHFQGGHATYVTGYDDLLKHINEGHILGTNSWGEDWGNDGDYQMPYDLTEYVVEDLPLKMLQEVWAVEFEKDIEPITINKVIELTVGSNEVTIDGVKKKLDTEPIIHKNRTLVPIRFIAEELGMTVKYDDGKITLTKE
jgi:hypothetical protein